MTQIRKHRGGLDESMATVFNVAGRRELLDVLSRELERNLADGDLEVKPYFGWDTRIGWDTHMIIIKDHGPYGFSNGPV